MTHRFVPMPIHSLVLFITWLALNDSVAPGHILLAIFFALGIPKLVEPLISKQKPIHKPGALIKYILILIWDIIIANLRVARLILGRNKTLRPSFIAFPLELEGDLPLTLLASTISLTPGTLSAEISKDKAWLYIHSLDSHSSQEVIDDIKSRYEQPLKEIFGC